MTDTQLYLAIGLPILAILTSLTVSLVQIIGIRAAVESLRADCAKFAETSSCSQARSMSLWARNSRNQRLLASIPPPPST